MSETSTKLIPHLVCRDALGALQFYKEALGAEVMMVMKGPDEKLMHGCMSVDGATVFLCEESDFCNAKSPLALGASPVTLHLQVADCDALFQQAVAAGCTAVMPPQEMFWGDRYGVFSDPYGHQWSVATTVRQLSPEEVQAAAANAFCGAPEA